MREILFRGKRADIGTWIEGNLSRCPAVENGEYRYNIMTIHMPPTHSRVLPETIGQYTDQLDKTGVRVFEGDIVKFQLYSSHTDVYVGKVVFNERTSGFEIWYDVVVGAYGEKATRKVNFGDSKTWVQFEVIGNIYDNPELIGE